MPNAAPLADVPSEAELALAAEFIREPVLLGDEDASVALGHGTARRRAIDQALAEQSEGLPAPSTAWRRRWSLLLGLERMLSVDEPTLADGTTQLGPHQVDALSGTLTALLTENQSSSAFVPADVDLDAPLPRNGNGRKNGAAKNGATPEAKSAAAAASAPADTVTSKRATPDLDDERDEDYDDEGVSGEGSDVHGPTIEDLAPTADELAELDAIDAADAEEIFDSSDSDQMEEQAEDPNAAKRFWFEHATGAGKTVAAMGFVDACRLGGVLILTHRRNLVEQFIDEIKTRGYKDRLSPPLLKGEDPVSERNTLGPVTVETYQWFVRHAGEISSAYTVVICDEAHTALGEKTSAAIREWTGPIFIGMTATGALIARHVADLFPTQTSRFDLAQAARRGVIAPLRCIRIPPGVGVRTIAKVPLRRGEVDMEFDQEMLAEVLDQLPFNLAAADLYKTRFGGMPGVVYAAGVKHAYNLADAFNEFGIKAKAVSGETPKRELSRTLADYENGKIDVLVNAQLLAEGWNSPRATVCLHLAPTASKRIYQQRVGRVTRREPGKEAGLVVDFVHPGTKHDDPVVTLHSLLDRDVYRGGAIVVGPVRRGRGRKVRVERRVLPVASDLTVRHEVFKRELWRIAVEFLDYGEQVQWAALAGAGVSSANWRKARAMLHFDRGGELKRAFLVTAIKRNPSNQVKLKAVQDIAALRDPEAFADAVDEVVTWSKNDRRDAVRVLLQSIADKPVGRRDQATAWIWQLAEATADEHEEYATQRWKEGKRLLGLLVNSAGPAHGRNARRLVQATREQDRRLQAAMLASARPHTPEAQQVVTGARTRLARKPGALARELLRNIPKAGSQPQSKGKPTETASAAASQTAADAKATDALIEDGETVDGAETTKTVEPVEFEAYTFEGEAAEHAAERSKKSRRSRSRRRKKKPGGENGSAQGAEQPKAQKAAVEAKAKAGNNGNGDKTEGEPAAEGTSRSRRRNRGRSRRKNAAAADASTEGVVAAEGSADIPGASTDNGNRADASPKGSALTPTDDAASSTKGDADTSAAKTSTRTRRTRKPAAAQAASEPKVSDPGAVKDAIAAAAAALAADSGPARPAAPAPAATSTAAATPAAEASPAPAPKTTTAKPRAPRTTAAKTTTTTRARTTAAAKTTAAKTTAVTKAATARKSATAATSTAASTPALKTTATKTAAVRKTTAAAKTTAAKTTAAKTTSATAKTTAA
ncbi:MAG: DEAD/DEAH box helicase family protein, partial [Solirubrobacteraceae bacterium]|nr:DEAD/DEAH box helicase family protein [Solirubrobacteraceae bacterium]